MSVITPRSPVHRPLKPPTLLLRGSTPADLSRVHSRTLQFPGARARETERERAAASRWRICSAKRQTRFTCIRVRDVREGIHVVSSELLARH